LKPLDPSLALLVAIPDPRRAEGGLFRLPHVLLFSIFALVSGDAKAKQVLSAFAVDTALALTHNEIDEKSNEIPAVQTLLAELDVAGHIVTCDAMHCQKKPSRPPPPPTPI
jgi:hypothetical protein